MYKKKITLTYTYICVCIILIFLLISQIYSHCAYPKTGYKRYEILFDSPEGLISVSNNKMIDELKIIKIELLRNYHNIYECDNLDILINRVNDNLLNIINLNPLLDNSKEKFDIKQNILDDILININPNKEELLERNEIIERERNDNENTTLENYKKMINYIDILIIMLEKNICDKGKINLNRIKILLEDISDCINADGIPTIKYNMKNSNIKYDNQKKEIPSSMVSIMSEIVESPDIVSYENNN